MLKYNLTGSELAQKYSFTFTVSVSMSSNELANLIVITS